MSRYQNVKVNISEGQKDKIERALKAESEVSIKLSHDDLKYGDYVLALTQEQINKMTKAYENGKGVTIKMSKTQIEYNKKVALLPMLATAGQFIVSKLLPSLVAGALAGIGTAAGSKLDDKISGGTIYVKRRGRDYKIAPYGQGLYLKPWTGTGSHSIGDGLYMKTGSGQFVKTGKGLILGENSQFKNIPILGWTL